jgi:CBS domain-containing protein
MKQVKDVMTTEVVVVEKDTSFKAIAHLLREHRLSALPVVDEDRHPVGIVSEADLILKPEFGEAQGKTLIAGPYGRRRAKARATTAAELMTSPVVTIQPEAQIGKAARTMDREKVKRLPVVDREGKLRGIVSRTDLLKIYLRKDAEVGAEIEEALMGPAGWVQPGAIRVLVRDGVVTLEGRAEHRSQVRVLLAVARSVDGVVDVLSRLAYEDDDVTPRLELLTPLGGLRPKAHR